MTALSIHKGDNFSSIETMPTTFRKTFAAWLKHARTTQGLTQVQLSERSGVVQSTVSSIERATHTLTDTTIDELATALGLTTVQLCDALASWSRNAGAQEDTSERTRKPKAGETAHFGNRSYVTPRVRSDVAKHPPTPVPLSPASRRRRQK